MKGSLFEQDVIGLLAKASIFSPLLAHCLNITSGGGSNQEHYGINVVRSAQHCGKIALNVRVECSKSSVFTVTPTSQYIPTKKHNLVIAVFH